MDIQLEICGNYIELGEFEKAKEVGLQAETTAKVLDDLVRLGTTYFGIGTSYLFRGNFEKTEHYALQAIQNLEGTGEERGLAISNQLLGGCYIGQGMWRKSEVHISKALKAIEGKPIRTGHVVNLYYDLVLAEVGLGEQESAKQNYEEGRPLVKMAPHWWEPRFDFLQGLLFMENVSPDYTQAEACFQRSIQGDQEVGAIVPAAQTRFYMAKVLAQKGEVERCRALLIELSHMFKHWGIAVWHQKCEQELEILGKSGT